MAVALTLPRHMSAVYHPTKPPRMDGAVRKKAVARVGWSASDLLQ